MTSVEVKILAHCSVSSTAQDPSPQGVRVPALTALQEHVLDHLDRVVELPYKVPRKNPLRRYQLDGKECTPQITSLIVHGYVREEAGGKLVQLRSLSKPTIVERRPTIGLKPSASPASAPRP